MGNILKSNSILLYMLRHYWLEVLTLISLVWCCVSGMVYYLSYYG